MDDVEAGLPADDRDPRVLDDERDRDELRQRYYGLLQEVRVLLPGVQILFAFLFVIPFDSAFAKLDQTGRDIYGVSLLTAFGAVVLFVAPTAIHRLGARRARVGRLRWSIGLCRAGLGFLAVSLVSGLLLVTRDVFGPTAGALISLVGALAVATTWVLLPHLAAPAEELGHRHR